jgi:hypothetical protein
MAAAAAVGLAAVDGVSLGTASLIQSESSWDEGAYEAFAAAVQEDERFGGVEDVGYGYEEDHNLNEW